jgi:hypothetical protein
MSGYVGTAGYGVGMMLSMLGEVPAGLLCLTAATLVALALLQIGRDA